MAAKYVDLLRASLKSVYPTLSDNDLRRKEVITFIIISNNDANSLILGEMADLQTSGTTDFSTIATQYGLTSTTINSTIHDYKVRTSGTACN